MNGECASDRENDKDELLELPTTRTTHIQMFAADKDDGGLVVDDDDDEEDPLGAPINVPDNDSAF